MGKTKKTSALWLVLTQGGFVSLAVYFAGLLGLSAMVMKGAVGEGRVFGVIAALCAAASFAGALTTGRRTPWGSLAAGAVSALIFVGGLGMAGLAGWGEILWLQRGAVLAGCALLGGVAAGMVCRHRRGKRVRR